MRGSYWQGQPNFGDLLNPWLWDQWQLPLKNDTRGLLYGIGTILRDPLPEERPLLIFGSGVGYGAIPVIDSSVEVFFVRGPHTSRVLGGRLPWITDPAILVADYCKKTETPVGPAFMPRWSTIEGDPTLRERLRDIGLRTIDPRDHVDVILDEIAMTSVLYSEALHGAVVADALRIPWVPIYAQHGHLFKWLDMTASLELSYVPSFPELRSMRQICAETEPVLSRGYIHTDRRDRVREQVERLKVRVERENV